MQLSVIQQAHLLDRLVLDEVRRAVDLGKLTAFEEWLAVELARVGGITDATMLATARTLVRTALARVADFEDDRELHTRYDNALSLEAVPELLDASSR